MSREFVDADAWQRGLRDAILVPLFYRPLFGDAWRFFPGRHPMQRKGIDTAVVYRGEVKYIDEKIVAWPKRGTPYTAFALETWSCTVEGYERAGWMFFGMADWMLYCFADESETALDCYLISFPKLKDWFWSLGEHYFPATRTDQFNHSECHVVPIDAVREAVPMRCYQLGRDA
jgi:hypothetical protein